MKFSTAILLVLAAPVSAADRIEMSAAQQAASGVSFYVARPADKVQSIPYPAQVVVPNAKLRVVSAPQDGVIEAMLVAEGEKVSKDQPLALLNSPQLLEQQRALLEGLSELKVAADRLDRDRAMVKDGIISQRRLVESQAELQRWTAAVQQRREALRLSGMPDQAVAVLERGKKLASSLQVSSPLDGVVLAQTATVGQRVTAADPLYRIGNLDRLWLEIHVPLSGLSGIETGSAANVSNPPVIGTVITVGRMVHSEDQGVMVRAEVSKDTDRLHPGQYVQVRLSIAGAQHALRVPSAALVRQNNEAYVFVATDGGLQAMPVQVLSEEQDNVVILGDMQPGARVVSSGVASVKAAWRKLDQ